MKELYGMSKQDYIDAIIKTLENCEDLELLYFVLGIIT